MRNYGWANFIFNKKIFKTIKSYLNMGNIKNNLRYFLYYELIYYHIDVIPHSSVDRAQDS